MGLTIHYSGSFNPGASLPDMISEVKDIAEINKWDYFIFEEDFPSPLDTDYNGELYGICFTPPECEMVSFTFLSNGRMCGPAQLQFFGKPPHKKNESLLYQLFTKTQFAGIEVHRQIVHLLKHISKKYMSEIIVYDEGQYWETGDDILLQQIFDRYNLAFETFAMALSADDKLNGETIGAQIRRLFEDVEIRQVTRDDIDDH